MTKRGMSPKQAQKLRTEKGIEDTKLQKLRIAKGFSQKDLSVASGVTLRAIQCYEQRTRNIDSARLNILCALAISLDCKIEDMLEDETLIDRYKMVK